MSGMITTAAAQYASRPADERYSTLADLVAAAEHDRQLCRERKYNLQDLRIDVDTSQGLPDLVVTSDKGSASLTHWAFNQLCRMVKAPADFLRTYVSPEIAATALNYRLKAQPVGSEANVLVRAANGNPFPTVRACTSETYGRAWDAPLYRTIADVLTSKGSQWELPPTWEGGATGKRAGAYRGDRDSFVILVSGGSIVTDPSAAGKGPESGGMYRGLIIRNSEVGASSVVLDEILYRYICGNHNLWGAVIDKAYRRRHVGSNVVSDVVKEVVKIAHKYANASPQRDEAIIRALISHEIATTKEGVIDALRAIGATKDQAISAYETCEQTENASPRSYWGIAQGLTRDSQRDAGGYQDERYELDKLAGLVLARGARLVAA